MTINTTGPIKIGGAISGQSINLELGRGSTAQSSMGESALRILAGATQGNVAMSYFRDKPALDYGFASYNIEQYDGSRNYYLISVQLIKMIYSSQTTVANGSMNDTAPGDAEPGGGMSFTFDAPKSGTGIFVGGKGGLTWIGQYNGIGYFKGSDIYGMVLASATYSSIATSLSDSSSPGAGVTNANASNGYMIGAAIGGGGGFGIGDNVCKRISLSTYATTTLAASALKPTFNDYQPYNGSTPGSMSGMSCPAHSTTIGYSIGGGGYSIERANSFGGTSVQTNGITGLTFSSETTAILGAFSYSGISIAACQNKYQVYNWTTTPETINVNQGIKLVFSSNTQYTFTGNSAYQWLNSSVALTHFSAGSKGCSTVAKGWMPGKLPTSVPTLALFSFATETATYGIPTAYQSNPNFLYDGWWNTFAGSFIGQHIHLQ